ncbi:hypothetical protein CVU82_04145 [Candidatus Falkowbacteria bacterium HGW-Falkowbacteria-1]|uniref:Lipoprotein signal peptidase n=1 Tax=Candidatus Falkowbacteria bacterium HGW-Falkowbacteria-1 TaxID=2013768 RepID=A0A2N2E967_9BACT|nr:MAG: hypothetical protein CVU82_04145 [Candidatus Falkowbacteria bacterium HGW-Falkowbacteria-1]
MINFFKKNKQTYNIAIFLIIAIFFIIDRFLKNLAISSERGFSLLGNILKFNFVPNEYIAFSIPIHGTSLFYFLSLLLVLVLVYFFFLFIKKKWFEFLCFFGIFLGALSNFIDRILYSFVIDYFDLVYFTVFNVADVLIFFSSLFLLVFYLKEDKRLGKS